MTKRTIQFDRGVTRKWPDHLHDKLHGWLDGLGLRAVMMPADALIVFDSAAQTVTTTYIVPQPGTEEHALPLPVKHPSGTGVVTEQVTVPYLGDLPDVPEQFRDASITDDEA